MKRKLAAVLACRNNGKRLFGKPLQALDIETNWSILDQIIFTLKNIKIIDEIVLAISFGIENKCFIEYAKKNSLKYVEGDEIDVLHRLNQGLNHVGATDLFRVTSESPFLYTQPVNKAWKIHLSKFNDATFFDEIIDGCGFEIIKAEALEKSWLMGQETHRSEMCTLFIRENKNLFRISKINCPKELIRKDIRLTVDYPEDLILCRAIYQKFFKGNTIKNEYLNHFEIVKYLDSRKDLLDLIYPFCEDGYKTMYL